MAFKDWFTRTVEPEEAKGGLTIRELEELQAYATSGTSSGITVSSDNALRVVAVFACVSVLSRSVAQTPMQLFKTDDAGTRTRDARHPVAVIMNRRPNSWQTPFEFKQMLQTHLCLRGNAYAQIIRIGRNVSALIPIHPDSVAVKQNPDLSIEYQVTTQAGKTIPLKQTEILHIRGLSVDGIIGLNPIAQARETVGLSMQTERHGARLFANGAQIGGVLEHPERLGTEASDRLRSQFDDRYAGVDNSHKTLLLEEGMKFSKIGMTSEDAQFLDTRKFQRSEIAALFGVPPHMIGDLERATFSNIEHQGLQFVRHSLAAWFSCWSQAFERDLLTPTELIKYEAAFDPSELTQGDFKSRMDGYSIGVQAGILSPNDARKREGENPREGGDEYLTPMNMNTTGRDPNADEKQPAEAGS